MFKKLLAFMCGLVPVGAWAATENISITDIPNVNDATVTVTNDEIKAVQSGNALQVYGDGLVDGVALDVSGDMRVFEAPIAQQSGGTLFVSDAVADTFSLQVDGDVTVGGRLTVNGDRTFNISNYTDDVTFGVNIGAITNNGTLNVTGVDDFQSGAIEAGKSLSISANTIDVGAVTLDSGSAIFNATGALTMAQLMNSGLGAASVDLVADSVQVGSIQNNAADGAATTGAMNVTVTGTSLNASGNIENSGVEMNIEAVNADIVVDGTMKNDAGKMIVEAASLTVGGGDADNASFVNNANLSLTITNKATFTNGINLNMEQAAWGNVLYLNVGELDLGAGNTAAFFANNLNDYKVIVNSAFSTGDISNGTQNADANMYLAATGLTVDGVTNNAGTMKLEGLETSDLVADFVTDKVGATTNLVAGGSVDISGDVTTNGTMLVQGQQVSLGGIVGTGGDLTVAGSVGEAGLVTVNGDVTNESGTVDISGRQINILGNVTNKSGNMEIGGSDFQENAILLGGVSVDGGVTYLNGLLGVDIAQSSVGTDTLGTGTLSVSGGVLNIGVATYSLTVGGAAANSGYVVDIAGNIVASATQGVTGSGDVYIAASGNQGFTLNANGAISVGGNVLATETTTVARTLTFASSEMLVAGNVLASGGSNRIVFQGMAAPSPLSVLNSDAPVADLTINGDLVASNNGKVEIHSKNVNVNSLSQDNATIYAYGNSSDAVQFNVVAGGVSIQDGIIFDATNTATKGLIIGGTSDFSLISQAKDQDMIVNGGIDISSDGRLLLQSGRNVDIAGAIYADGVLDIKAMTGAEFANDVLVSGALNIFANDDVVLQDITNTGFVDVTSGQDVAFGVIKNSASTNALPNDLEHEFNITADGDVTVTAIESTGGLIDVAVSKLDVAQGMDITDGAVVLNAADGMSFGGGVNVSGVLNQGVNKAGMLNLVVNDIMFTANNLSIGGFIADSGVGTYDVAGNVTVNGDMTVGTDASLATVYINAETFENTDSGAYTFTNLGAFKLSAADSVAFDDVINSGSMVVNAAHGVTMAAVQNTGTLSIDSGDDVIDMTSLLADGGTLSLYGMGLDVANALTTSGMLYQNYTGELADNDIGIFADEYSVTASNITVSGIEQTAGTMGLYSSDVTVNGDISASDLIIAASPDTNWLDLDVTGDVSGGVKIWNLEQMTVGGDYIFDGDSQLLTAVLPYNVTPGLNSTTRNYWSTVSLNNDDTFGHITNAEDGAALIQVGGTFTAGTQYDSGLSLNTGELTLADGQIGLRFTDVSNISAETAIWLLSAEGGVAEFSNLEKIRNLSVLFCNAGNTKCVTLNNDNLGAYISMRDALEVDGIVDSLYVVFDPRFGGPVLIENNRIQPIVARQPGHTDGEYVAAGALDNLIDGQLFHSGFFNGSPIEVIPAIFEGTNVEKLMTELYDRMDYYVGTADGSVFVPFSRLVQPREIEQVMGAMVLNEHTSFRNFEDRMLDEFIWNRNRNLKKVWADFDFGMFSQNVTDDKRVYGNRFELSGGFDWQESETLILGLTGRVSHMSSDNSDKMNLGYIPGKSIDGHVDIDVADTNVGLGGYLMKTLGYGFRLYGNAFVDMHLFDTTRNQTFVDTIEGTGTAFALTTEWGLMHDWLNQYIVGNLYARAGYNFGFSITEEAAGENYMDLESDGYLMLTPGYSLTAQKRIYPSAWFQIRPYATIGVEYDVLGAPDHALYKFASANVFSEYDIEIDPLWANIGGGFEFLSANGLQFGIDYRYQYNNDMQLHNIKVSGSYRF